MTSQDGSQVFRHQNRGLKRPRGTAASASDAPDFHKPPAFGDSTPSASTRGATVASRDAAMSDDETVQPLSKRINRLNIDHPASAGRISPPDQALPSHSNQDAGQLGQQPPPSPSEPDFTQVYPYAPDSPYFQSNQLLRDLYLQREMRIQQQQDPHQNVRHRLYGCSTPSIGGSSFQHLQ